MTFLGPQSGSSWVAVAFDLSLLSHPLTPLTNSLHAGTRRQHEVTALAEARWQHPARAEGGLDSREDVGGLTFQSWHGAQCVVSVQGQVVRATAVGKELCGLSPVSSGHRADAWSRARQTKGQNP